MKRDIRFYYNLGICRSNNRYLNLPKIGGIREDTPDFFVIVKTLY